MIATIQQLKQVLDLFYKGTPVIFRDNAGQLHTYQQIDHEQFVTPDGRHSDAAVISLVPMTPVNSLDSIPEI